MAARRTRLFRAGGRRCENKGAFSEFFIEPSSNGFVEK
jgi:hypothetical protein